MSSEIETMPDSAPTPGAAERSLQDDLQHLFGEGMAYARSEVAYQKERVGFAAAQVPWLAVYGIAAFVFVFFALGAIVVGLIIALTPLLTAWGATAVVTAVLLIGAFLCLRLALGRWRALMAAVSGKETP